MSIIWSWLLQHGFFPWNAVSFHVSSDAASIKFWQNFALFLSSTMQSLPPNSTPPSRM